jgi:hypothetical protein
MYLLGILYVRTVETPLIFALPRGFWNWSSYFTLKWHGIIALFRGSGCPMPLAEKIQHCVEDSSGESLLATF